MPDHQTAWSVDDEQTVQATIAGQVGVPVHIGRAPQGAVPPFVTAWPIDATGSGESLGDGVSGVRWQAWQINPHGRNTQEARTLAEQISDGAWPDLWRFEEAGPMVNDTTDNPDSWFYPLTFRCQAT